MSLRWRKGQQTTWNLGRPLDYLLYDGKEHIGVVSFSQKDNRWYWYAGDCNSLWTSQTYETPEEAKKACADYIRRQREVTQ